MGAVRSKGVSNHFPSLPREGSGLQPPEVGNLPTTEAEQARGQHCAQLGWGVALEPVSGPSPGSAGSMAVGPA